MKNIFNKAIALVLALSTILTIGIIPAQAESISDGNSKTVTVTMGTRNSYLTTTNGNTLNGMEWTYKSNTGLTGPAYCVDWGLAAPSTSKELTISGLFTANPKTMGAFATGHPQRALGDFVNLYLPENPALAGLTQDEYAYATQVAVWSSLGQLAVDGTSFNEGRATLAVPQYDAQQIRVYTAIKIILDNAAYWYKPMKTSMEIRNFKDSIEKGIYLEHERGLAGIAESNNTAGVKLEIINGTRYYTREFTASSGTSTWRNGYFIDLWHENAPEGTIFASENNVPLDKDGDVWKLPTVIRYTTLNPNDSEYWGTFKLCIPVNMTKDDGNITIHSSSTVAQFNIYLANNTDHTEQSYVIADPAYTPISASTTFKWATVKSIYGEVTVLKADEYGKPIEGAVFELVGNGKTYAGTSDRDGRIFWSDLAPGNYTLKEIKAPEGYRIANPVNVSVVANEVSNVTVTNESFRNFQIRKTDAQNGYPLLGATFRFEQIDGGYSTDAVTGHDGYISFTGGELPFGNYRVYEVTAPAGYYKDTSVQTVNWDGRQDVLLSFTNVRTPGITLIKTEADSNLSLEGAVFNVYKDGALITTVTTNSSGEARINGLSEGYYEFEETVAPAGYVLDSARHGIHVDPYDPATINDPVLVVTNKTKPGLKVIKYDALTMKPIAGVVFEVLRDTVSLGTYTTDIKGEINLTDLATGTYTVREVATSPGYIINSAPQQIELTAGQTATLVFLNQLKPGIRLVKLDSETMKPLAGARFLIEQIGGSFSKEFVTGSTGEIELTALEPGAYSVKELSAPDGYIVDDNIRVIQINANENGSFVFINTPKPGMKLIKIDASTNQQLADAVFRIAKIGDGTRYFDRTTDSKGEITLTGLDVGIYSVKELYAPNGYLLNEQEYHVETFAGQTSQIIIGNKVKPSLKIIKYDAQTLKPMPDTTFEVYRDTTLVGMYTTDSKGEILLSGLTPGTYSVKEVSTDNNHIVNSTPQQIEIIAGNHETAVLVFFNQVKPGIHLIKVDSETMKPLAGAIFLISRVGGGFSKEYTTPASGEIDLTALEPGAYTVKELSAPSGYVIDNEIRIIQINAGENASFVFTNTKKPGLIVWKYDQQTAKPLPNAEFSISYKGGEVIYEGITGAEGNIRLDNLKEGWVTVTELAPPPGYLLSNPASRDVYLVPGRVTEIKFDNYKCPTLTIQKIDSATNQPLAGATFRIAKIGDGTRYYDRTTDSNGEINMTELEPGIYSVREIIPPSGYILNDTEYHVELFPGKASQLIVENDVKPQLRIIKYDQISKTPMPDTTFEVYRDATLIGTYTTGSNGQINLSGLEPGTYLVKEIATDDAHVVNSTPQQIEIKAGSHETVVLVFFNQLKPGIHLVKLDSETMQPLANATFRITKVGGSFDKEFTTDKNGEIDLSKLEPGAYQVREIKAPDGYLIDDGIRTIQINPDENAMFVFTDTKKPSIEVFKYDPLLDKYLPGATFRIAKIEDGSNYLDRVTDTNGRIYIDNLMPGVYSVKEIAAPSNYVINEMEYHVELFGGETSRLVVINEIKPSLKIVKTDAVTGKPIPGTAFTVKKVDGQTLTTVTTDANGEILLQHIDPGVYEIREKSVPNDWLLDETPQYITLVPNQTSEVRFRNYPKPALTIKKIDSQTGEPLKGAKFSVVYASNNTFTGEINDLGSYTTDADGIIKLTHRQDGWYKITEITPPNNYVISENPVQEVYIKAGEDKTVTFENTKKPNLTVNKVDAITKDAIKGAKFTIWRAKTDSLEGELVKVGDYTSDADGKIVLENLEPGWYRVKETATAAGYTIKSPDTQDFYLKAGENKEITFENQPKNAIIIRKVDADTGEMLPGARFTIRYASNGASGTSGTVIGEYLTSVNGTIVVTGLKPGAYIVEETRAPQGYIMVENAPQTVWLTDDETSVVEVTFVNRKEAGLLIKKMDADTKEPLADCIFKVTDSRGTVVGESNGEFRTDEKGFIHITGLTPGAYVVTEVQAKDGYVIDNTPQTVHVEFGKLHALEFFNKKLSGLVIKKMDADTKEPLSDCVFRVTDAKGAVIGTSNGEYRTDEKGLIQITDLTPGAYVVAEVKAKDGYILDNTAQTVNVESEKLHALEFFNKKLSGLVIKKMDADTKEPLSDCVFRVTDAKGAVIGTSNGEYRTDEKGLIQISDLTPGAYVVTEVKAKDGYILDNTAQTVNVEFGKLHTLEFFNKKLSGLVIKKLDNVTKKPLAGAVFKITYSDGTVIGTSNGDFTTDKDGLIVLNNLPSSTIIVREVKAPDGYVMDDAPQTVKIEQSKTHTLTFYNNPMAGLQIHKTDSVTGHPLSGARFKVTKMNGEYVGEFTTERGGYANVGELEPGWYTIVETRAPSGYILESTPKNVEIKTYRPVVVEFENTPAASLQILKVDEDTRQPISGVDFAVAKMNGQRIGTYTTDYRGLITLPKLDAGWYTVTEVKAAKGYMIDTSTHTIEIKDGDMAALTVTNKKAASILIKKIDSVTKKGIYGAVFLIYDENNNPIGEWTSDQDGYVWVTKQLPEGRYKIREVKAADGYALDTQIKTVYVTAGKTSEVYWENTPVKGQIIITKKSSQYNEMTNLPAGSTLAGAVFEVYDRAGNVVDKMVSDSCGIAASKPLAPSLYTVKEVSAPKFYVLNDKLLYAEIRKDGDVVRFEVLNDSVKLGVTIQKKGNSSAIAGQQIRYDLYEIRNTSSAPLQNFYIHDRIPTDAARITKLFTGTYNQRAVYSVSFKTNYRDYRLLQENLYNNVNYELSLNPQTLGLMEGEYVTDVRFEFGTVQPGFAGVENIIILCDVLPNLPAGYNISNRADVGGQYAGEWLVNKASWVTVVQQGFNPKPLPKTGY